MNKIKTILLWAFSVFCLLAALVSVSYGGMGIIGCLLMLAAAALALPVKQVREFWEKLFPQKAVKLCAIVVAFFLGMMVMPTSDTDDSYDSAGDAYVENLSLEAEAEESEQTEDTTEETEAESTEEDITEEKTTKAETTKAKETTEAAATTQAETSEAVVIAISSSQTFSIDDVSEYKASAYVEINDNVPYFTLSDLTTTSYEYYSDLDSLGRCGVAVACIGQDIMPTEERGEIGSIKPTGWHTVKYDIVDGNYLYNRCHLIAYQLAGENANELNLITGTRYLNTEGMLPYEEMVADYVNETDNHVLYRVTPIFEGDNLIASGVLMEAMSVEDLGAGIEFNVFCYNVQPGVEIDYATGDSELEEDEESTTAETTLVAVVETTTAAPETTTVAPETTTAAPETTTAAPETTTAPPETTTAAPETTTAAPETTTVAVETTTAASVSTTTYVLNTNTMKFHRPTCRYVSQIHDENRWDYTGSRADIIAMGYEPCKVCDP